MTCSDTISQCSKIVALDSCHGWLEETLVLFLKTKAEKRRTSEWLGVRRCLVDSMSRPSGARQSPVVMVATCFYSRVHEYKCMMYHIFSIMHMHGMQNVVRREPRLRRCAVLYKYTKGSEFNSDFGALHQATIYISEWHNTSSRSVGTKRRPLISHVLFQKRSFGTFCIACLPFINSIASMI